MSPADIAATHPDKPAYIMAETGDTVTFAQLEATAKVFRSQCCVFEAWRSSSEKPHGKSSQEDEQGAPCGVKNEFGGSVLAFFAAPDGK